MLKRFLVFLLVTFIIVKVSYGCVGKTIYVGYVDNKNDEITGNIFARLILERTGTSAKLKKYNTPSDLLSAAQSGDVDLFIFSEDELKKVGSFSSKEQAKAEFNVKYNLVWLKPIISEQREFLVPIIRKDTLKKFPALPKLLEKLEGKLNSKILAELNNRLAEKSMKELVKDFLKEHKLI